MATQRRGRAGRRTLVTTLLAASIAACSDPMAGHHLGWSGRDLDAERRCQQDAVPACGELGRSLVARKGNGPDRERGLVLLELACGRDDWPSCTVLGQEYTEGARATALARAREVLARACDHGDGQACMALGEAYGTGAGKSVPAAITAYRRACELGAGAGCEVYAISQMRERFGGDKKAAEEAFERACALGQGTSCRHLARERLRDPARREEGMKMLKNGCSRGDVDSCLEAAFLFAPLLGASPRCDEATALGRLACAGESAAGCTIVLACQSRTPEGRARSLAELRSGCERHEALACLYWADAASAPPPTEPPADGGLVAGAYEIACRAGERASAIACPRMAAGALGEASTSLDAEEPLALLKAACERGVGEACCSLAAEYARGKWLPLDPFRAAELRTRARDLGRLECHEPPDSSPK